jgi:DNA primase
MPAKPRPSCPLSFDADDATVLRQCIDYYHESLQRHPEGLDYLKGRGIDHPDAISTFRLGIANRTLGLTLPVKQLKDGAAIRAQLERIGIYRGSGHEHLNGSIVVPVLDPAGRVLQAYGRKVNDNLRAGTPKHLMLPGELRGVWNREAIAEGGEAILAGGFMDALSWWCAGHRKVTATFGLGGYTDELHAVLSKLSRVILSFPRTPEGETAAASIADRFAGSGVEVFAVAFPPGHDANECLLKLPGGAEALGGLLRRAQWIDRVPRVTLPLEEVPEASPAPEPLPGADTCEQRSGEVTFRFGDRRYRVRGLERNTSFDLLKVNLLASRGEHFHLDTLDLYSAKARGSFITQAAAELLTTEEVVKTDLGRVLLRLEELQEAHVSALLKPARPDPPEVSGATRAEALAFLRSPDLLERIAADFDAVGLVGERETKLVAYLAAVSRKLSRPLGLIVQSASAAGKSSLVNAVLDFVPEEDRVQFSSITGQSLYYMGETTLAHKVLALAEEEGARRASYALKLLQSEGELRIASTGKDPKTGNLIAQEYRVSGPVALLMTTTAVEVDPELLNRCLVLAVDEGRETTRAIHRRQRTRRTLAAFFETAHRVATLQRHQASQRLLRPLAVVNPYAEALTFPDATPRLRRDHEKYLTLIDAIALLHQHQREVRAVTVAGKPIDYIEVTPDDIAHANSLAGAVLGRSLDELPPQTRRLLGEIAGLVRDDAQRREVPVAEVRFTRRELRERLGWGDTQLKIHLARLVALELLVAHRLNPGRRHLYELAFEGGSEGASFPGLIDAQGLPRSGDGRGAVGAWSGGGRAPGSGGSADASEGNAPGATDLAATHIQPSPVGAS